jgi:predicted AAA+ superfamily ATPase
VALVGPRQCGKTTLAQSLDGQYFDLEQDTERLRVDLEWDTFEVSAQTTILDEAQSWPEVFVRLRGAIDRDRKRMGRFLLLGSVSPPLMVQVSESLAGRLSIVELTASPEARVNPRVKHERR